MVRHLFLVNGYNPFSYGQPIDVGISRNVGYLNSNFEYVDKYNHVDNPYYNLVFIHQNYRKDFGFKYKELNSSNMKDVSNVFSAHFTWYTESRNGVSIPQGVKNIRIISVGGGGSGGSGGNEQNGDGGSGGGGGCGGIYIVEYNVQSFPEVFNVIIGSGGAYDNNNGKDTYITEFGTNRQLALGSGGSKGGAGGPAYAGKAGTNGTISDPQTTNSTVTMTSPTGGEHIDNGLVDKGGSGGYINYSTFINSDTKRDWFYNVINGYGNGGKGGNGDKLGGPNATWGSAGGNGILIIFYYYTYY